MIGYPVGGGDRRVRRAELAAGGLRLAGGVPVRRGGDRGDDPAGLPAGSRNAPRSTRRAGRTARSTRSTARCARLRQPPIDRLPEIAPSAPKPKVTEILSDPRLRPVTLLLAFGYLFHTITFYYILKFAVQIVADSGFSQPEAASTLTWANIGGAIGGFLFGFLLRKWDIKGPLIACAVLGSAAVAYFGLGSDSLWGWRVTAFLTMFFLNAAIVGYYAAFARGFPAFARATGTGFVLGVGRAGAAGSPIIAGFLFAALGGGNEHLLTVSSIMAIGAIVGALLIWLLPLRDADRDGTADAAKAA